MRRWVGTREELRALICDRRDELDVSHETLDFISGLQPGYVSKLLAPDPIRNFGPESLRALLGALALKIVKIEIAEDPEAAAKVSGRWTPKKHHRRPKPSRRCVVGSVGEAQSAFTFEHETEQGPNERQAHDDDYGARRRDAAGAG
jgi:hypothetical protein